MKKLYILLLFALVTNSAFAQADLQLFRYIANVSRGEALHLMTNTDTIYVNPNTANPVQYAFAWLVVNHGPTHFVASDSIYVLKRFEGVYQWTYGKTSDSIIFGIDTIKGGFDTTSATGLYSNECDSTWAKHAGGTILTDPNLSNNHYCNNLYVKKFKLAVSELPNNTPSSLNIYPNPASSNVNLSYDFTGASKATLSILDVVGRKVYEEEITDLSGKKTMTVNVSKFTPGIYMATLVVDDVRIVGKFNVQK